MTFRQATPADAPAVLALYRSVIGTKNCTWDEEYPGEAQISRDTAAGALFLMEQDSRLVGAVSLAPENELDDLPFWRTTEGAGEIARVVIHPEFQGKGYSTALVSRAMEELKGRGYRAAHLAVAEINRPAQKTYFRLGFVRVGEWDMYGNHYLICEKELI